MKTATRPLPPVEFLRKILSYNPDTGDLIWKKRTPDSFDNPLTATHWNTRYAGKKAGDKCRVSEGFKRYSLISIKDENYLTHRIVWAIHNGRDPGFLHVDHINHDPSDNRICNLRACTLPENNLNVRGHAVRKYDLPKGVYVAKKRFIAKIQIGRTPYVLGRFDCPEDAHKCYKAGAEKLHKEFACFTRKGAAPSVEEAAPVEGLAA